MMFWADVPVNDPMVMRFSQRVGNLLSNREGFFDRQACDPRRRP